jgi:SAM-dependent methyltransferase
MGCGYGTFTIPVARRVSGVLTTFDIDEAMIERTRQRAAAAGAWNVLYMVGDVFADGFGGEAGSKDACLLFNILHCEEPLRLLAEAARVVRPGGEVLVIHWRCDPVTPRGAEHGGPAEAGEDSRLGTADLSARTGQPGAGPPALALWNPTPAPEGFE